MLYHFCSNFEINLAKLDSLPTQVKLSPNKYIIHIQKSLNVFTTSPLLIIPLPLAKGPYTNHVATFFRILTPSRAHVATFF